MSKALVLVVDDEQTPRDVACSFVEGADCEVVSARHAKEALEILENNPRVSVVLTDMSMPPYMHGGELGQQIASRFPQVRVVYMSGRSKAGLVREGYLDESAPFIAKPFWTLEEFRRDFIALAFPSS